MGPSLRSADDNKTAEYRRSQPPAPVSAPGLAKGTWPQIKTPAAARSIAISCPCRPWEPVEIKACAMEWRLRCRIYWCPRSSSTLSGSGACPPEHGPTLAGRGRRCSARPCIVAVSRAPGHRPLITLVGTTIVISGSFVV